MRRVIASAEVKVEPGTWRWDEALRTEPSDGLAAVRDGDVESRLVPTESDDDQALAVLSFHFDPHVDNSGFVGWLATELKQTVGTGVVVVCGSNAGRGGIFDYWCVPARLTDEVLAVVERLRSPDPLSLDLRTFRVVSTSPASAITADTLFEFRERDGLVEASYSGGRIRAGRLVGRRLGTDIRFAYAQLHTDDVLRTGESTSTLEDDPNGVVRLVERYTWADGETGENVLESC
jgi:hypothetical protein